MPPPDIVKLFPSTLAVGLFIQALSGAGSAYADDARGAPRVSAVRAATLVYDVPSGKACPEESSFRNLVGARLGADPFVAESASTMGVRIRSRGGALVGTVELTIVGSVPRRREIETRDSCESLAAALAATVAFSLDPLGQAARTANADAPLPPTPSSTHASASPETARRAVSSEAPSPKATEAIGGRTEPASPRLTPLLTLAGAPGVGLAPSPTLGAELGAGVRRGALSLLLQGRFDTLSGKATLDSGARVELTLLGLGLAPCGSFSAFRLCGVARAGIAQGRAAGTDQPAPKGSTFVAVAARPGFVLPLASFFALSAEIELGAMVVRPQLVIDRKEAWTAPPVFASAVIGGIVAFGDGS